MAGLAIYLALAAILRAEEPTVALFDLAAELVLPEPAARRMTMPEIAAIQIFAPVGLVRSVYVAHRGSGVIRVS